ncbi:preprotein translocase subunit SCY1, chloroplastic isoform X1 [Populus trichocarpa]|uniref:preprotein translocase subunit SCY1, chloroplastic isoform X1 n=1 Tax=Populus trichocarpa TaxID=3694 RepID=UPI000D1899A1|nr:preprotein translocase subunit SCY1, chloroplastic isoform X1 [Populus trichocarpa]|eukprot:XP_024458308.1 preprotein translocase subunit SCY1, chloroplastic isoform X1 [Populus trichocarpa]
MLLTVREACPCSPISFNLSRLNSTRFSQRLKTSVCRASFSVQPKPNAKSWNSTLNSNSCESSSFDPLGINLDGPPSLNAAWESLLAFLSPILESASNTRKDKRGVAAAIEDSSIDFGDFFKGPLPGKFLKLLGFLVVSRLGIYIPLGGVNREAFAGNLDQNSLLSTLDSFSGGGIGRLGIFSLGIVPFINAQIVFQLLAQIYPKLQDLQKREGEAGRKKILQYTRYASVGFAIVQAIGQVLYLRPFVDDFSTQWVLTSVTLLTLGSVFTTYIGEQISDLKLGNGTSLLIFTSIISYLPASFGQTAAQAIQDGNYVGLGTIIFSFFLLVLGIVYVQDKGFQEAERKIPLNYASRYTSSSSGLQKSAYLPFKVNSSGVMPIIFSTSSLALPGTLARFTGISALKKAALTLNPGGSFYLPTNILLIAFFNYYYTFLQLDPDDVSEQLKRQGASIPLVRPGKSTAAFLKTVLSRISVLGSTFLAILAAGPSVIEQISHLTAFRGFAGTSVLILVGCATDTARKVQAEIISQKYKNIEFYDIDRYD